MSAGGSFELAIENAVLTRRELRLFSELPDTFGSAFNCETYLELRDAYDSARRELVKVHLATGTTSLFDGRGYPERPYPELDAIVDDAN